jgi:hypothetical protein
VTGDCHAGICGSRGLQCPRPPDPCSVRGGGRGDLRDAATARDSSGGTGPVDRLKRLETADRTGYLVGGAGLYFVITR